MKLWYSFVWRRQKWSVNFGQFDDMKLLRCKENKKLSDTFDQNFENKTWAIQNFENKTWAIICSIDVSGIILSFNGIYWFYKQTFHVVL